MHTRLYEYFESNDLIFSLQFGFRQNHSTLYALLNMTEEIKKQIDRGNIGCGVFIDFQKAFDTVDHNILIEKLNHYGVRDLQNEWFKSYLINRKQYVTVNNESSDLENIKWGVPQGSILGPILFLIYIKDSFDAIQHCKVIHFADDTNLSLFTHSISKLNKLVNKDLKRLVRWLNANKISLNIEKTELVIFKSKKKCFDGTIKII